MQADYERALREHRVDLAYRDKALAGLIETIAQPDHLLIENVALYLKLGYRIDREEETLTVGVIVYMSKPVTNL